MIAELIELLRAKTKYKYIFNKHDKLEDCVVYSYNDAYNDNIKKSARLTLNIITTGIKENSILKAEKMKNTINSVILTLGDEPLTNAILSITQNGGGQIPNEVTDTLHTILYYDIIGYKYRLIIK